MRETVAAIARLRAGAARMHAAAVQAAPTAGNPLVQAPAGTVGEPGM